MHVPEVGQVATEVAVNLTDVDDMASLEDRYLCLKLLAE